jgi:glutaredoxin 3
MATVEMFSTRWCGYCVRAKALLEQLEIPFEETLLDDDPHFRATLHERTGGWTVPQILVDGRPIGGYSELWQLARSGRLAELLAA